MKRAVGVMAWGLMLLLSASTGYCQEDTYVNEEYKVSLKAPEGWYLIRMKKKMIGMEKLVKFSEYPASSHQFSEKPYILLQVNDQPEWANNLDEYMKNYFKMLGFGFKLLGTPKDVLINGNRGVRLESQLALGGISGGRTIEYLFWKNDRIYSLTLNVGEEDMGKVDKYLEIFDSCARTFLIEE